MTDLTRCSWCGRTGTLTSLSAGNRCVLEDDCHAARAEVLARTAAFSAPPSEASTEDWCLTHNKRITTRFTAAVCPNDIGCQVVPKPSSTGSSPGVPEPGSEKP